MKNKIWIQWFHIYLINNGCVFMDPETIGNTETWKREVDNKIKYFFLNNTSTFLELLGIKNILNILQLSFSDCKAEWDEYSKHL